jgi:hypothetical protein
MSGIGTFTLKPLNFQWIFSHKNAEMDEEKP